MWIADMPYSYEPKPTNLLLKLKYKCFLPDNNRKEINNMTREQKLAIMKERKNRMMNVKSVQNLKCGGVLKALTREIRNAEAALSAPM